MAKEQLPSDKSKPIKLNRLPKGSKISKRPLLHPPVAALRTGSGNPKVVYVSCTSPFVASVKRVRSYLKEIEKRGSNSASKINLSGPGTDREKLDKIAAISENGEVYKEVVTIKATGKAIEKALQIALHFQGQDDCDVKLKTGSVGAVDDYEEDGEEKSRVRMTSVLEVLVRLKG